MIKKCEQCNSNFNTNRNNARFCCYDCYWKSLKGKKYKIKKLTCEYCKKEFEVNRHLNRKFCSQKCFHKSLQGIKFQRKDRIKIMCIGCGKEFEVCPSGKNRKYCSIDCRTKFNRGKNHCCWQGGKTSEYDKFKASDKFKKWRKEVFVRDNYTCQDCGYRSGNGEKHRDIHPHHIKSASKYPELRLDINNGVTLCKNCHGKRHSINFKNRKYIKY